MLGMSTKRADFMDRSTEMNVLSIKMHDFVDRITELLDIIGSYRDNFD